MFCFLRTTSSSFLWSVLQWYINFSSSCEDIIQFLLHGSHGGRRFHRKLKNELDGCLQPPKLTVRVILECWTPDNYFGTTKKEKQPTQRLRNDKRFFFSFDVNQTTKVSGLYLNFKWKRSIFSFCFCVQQVQ